MKNVLLRIPSSDSALFPFVVCCMQKSKLQANRSLHSFQHANARRQASSNESSSISIYSAVNYTMQNVITVLVQCIFISFYHNGYGIYGIYEIIQEKC